MHTLVAPGTTFCADTPQSWREFERKKLAIQEGRAGGRHQITSAEEFNQALQKQICAENKSLRSLRRHLPGLEPDHA